MKGKNSKGFTLVELVVVIAIIGIIAAILVPTLMNYVKKAGAKADVASAKQLYNTATQLLMEDEDAKTSFYKYNTTVFHVDTESIGGSDSYDLVVVCKLNGAANTRRKENDSVGWHKGNNESQEFCDALNAAGGFVEQTKARSMKHRNHPDGVKTDLWLLCYRSDDKDRIEIWAGNSHGTFESDPKYRVYPSPEKEYTNP
ncbi:MAG: prepilin-type N-terminal cleavage/methylation domain-containing protein [Ruminococcus sp.]|nr:prepilin-type N-terminal cleavage/methylation domain-containing protein [Ruminococcus sp.]